MSRVQFVPQTATALAAADVTPPVITILGDNPLAIEQHSGYLELGATALDDQSGSVAAVPSGTVNHTIAGTYTITYTATDAANNVSTATRTVNVIDSVAPIITLTGDALFSVDLDGTYTDPGASAFDAEDGVLPVTISGDVVDASVLGDYNVIYTAIDAAGNVGTNTRIVRVAIAPRYGNLPNTVDVGLGGTNATFNADRSIMVTSTAVMSGNYRVATVRTYSRTGTVWTLIGTLSLPYGNSVGLAIISPSGMRMAIPAQRSVPLNITEHSIRLYSRVGGVWTQTQILTGPAPFTPGSYGRELAFNNDDTHLVVYGLYRLGLSTFYNQVVDFLLSGNTYLAQPTPIVDEVRDATNNQGYSVRIASDDQLQLRSVNTSTPGAYTASILRYTLSADDWVLNGPALDLPSATFYGGYSQDGGLFYSTYNTLFNASTPIVLFNALTGAAALTITPDTTFGLAYPDAVVTQDAWVVSNCFITEDNSEFIVVIRLSHNSTTYWRTHVYEIATGNLIEESPEFIHVLGTYTGGAVYAAYANPQLRAVTFP